MVVCYQGPTAGCPLPPEATFGAGVSGNGAYPQATQQEPVNTATGNYISQATDARLPGRGLGFTFKRTYNSLSTEVGVLGLGWTHSYAARILTNPDGSATFVGEDGARTTYAADGAGGFVRPPGAYGILTPVQGGGFELRRKDQVRLRFDALGNLLSQTDRNNNVISLAYQAGQLTTITDTVGRTVSLGYDQGRLASLAFPPSRTVTYQYDVDGRLWKVTDPESGVTTYTYDPQGRLATITDANNHQVVENIYGPDGRVSEQVDARGYHSFFDWDPVTETSTMTDARGGEWVDDYYGGILVSQSDPLGNTTQYSFDASLGLAATIDANGRTFVTDSDTFGNPLKRRYPQPFDTFETWTYNANNDPLTHRDRRGNTTTFTYDSAGNLKTLNEPYAQGVYPVTTYNYDPAGTGLLFSVVDPLLKTTSYGYDVDANRDRVTTPLGNVTTMAYDAAGRMTSLVEPRGNATGADPEQYRTLFSYDGLDRLRTTTTPLGNVTTIEYDPVGNRTAVTDANTNATAFEYDDANHLTVVRDALLQETTYDYDEVGNLIMRTDANTHVTDYTYDLAGRLLTEQRPLGRTWTYTYSPTGKVTKVIDPIAAATPDPNDFQATFGYDELDRLSSANYGASGTTTLGYDANDNRTSVANATGTASYTYDALNRLVTYRFGTRGIDYGTRADDLISTRTYTDGTVVTNSWDNDGRLTAVTSGAATTTYGYDVSGNLTTTTLPSGNGYVESRTYDRDGRLTEVKNQKGQAVLSKATYALDPVGNRTSTQTTTETINYDYDELDRLTEACYTPSCTGGTDPFRRYAYDPVGNRLTEARSAGTTTYAYNELDELTGTTGFGGTVNYTYDLDGQTLTAGAASMTWTRQGWLATRTQGGTTTTYTYDGDGLRFQASTGTQASKKTQFDWDPLAGNAQLVAERNGSGSLLRRYVNGHNPISVTAGNKTAYLHYDGLGSVVNLTSSTGATWWTYDYLPYGGVRTETKNSTQAIDNTRRFAGEYLDPTGLYYLRAREYDSGIGRFLSNDPVPARVGDPYVSAYQYVRQNPVRFTDPSGKCLGPLIFLLPACITVATGAIAGVAGYVAGNTAVNVIDNVRTDRPLTDDLGRGLNLGDAAIAAGAGVIGGPLAGLSFTPTRVLAGAALGCSATFASQVIGGRENQLSETAIGCAAGGVAGLSSSPSALLSSAYGIIVATAQSVTTYFVGQPNAGAGGAAK